MLKTIVDIGGHMIQASVCRAFGDLAGANAELYEAGSIAECDGYCHVSISDEYKEPSYLATYPELKSFWEHGYVQGISNWEIEHCSSCQDPDIEMCSAHDY